MHIWKLQTNAEIKINKETERVFETTPERAFGILGVRCGGDDKVDWGC